MIIPESGKPVDLKLSQIKTVADADKVLTWLADVLKDMETQFRDKPSAATDDPEWLKRARHAQRATTTLRHRVLEKRDELYGKCTLHEAIVRQVVDDLDDETFKAVEKLVIQKNPHLAGTDFEALRG